MSCLDTFCTSHFEERDDLIRISKKGLLLWYSRVLEKGYEVGEQKYPWYSNKEAASKGKRKKNVDDCIDPSNDELEELMGEEDYLDVEEDDHHLFDENHGGVCQRIWVWSSLKRW